MEFKTKLTEIHYQGRAFKVRRDQVQAPNGQMMSLDIVEHVGAVTIIPLDAHGQVWFVRQYRHAAGETLLELPAGTLEAGEHPDVCARREIREEIGMAARKLEKVGEFYLAPGYSTEYMHVYLAQELHPDPLPRDADEFLSIEAIPLAQVKKMVRQGELKDAKSLAALLLVEDRLRG